MSVAFSPTPTRSTLGNGFTMGSVKASGTPECSAADEKQNHGRDNQEHCRPPMEINARGAGQDSKKNEDTGSGRHQNPVPQRTRGPDFSCHLHSLHAGLDVVLREVVAPGFALGGLLPPRLFLVGCR